MARPRFLLAAATVLLVNACASGSGVPYTQPDDPDAGTIEFINQSPGILFSVVIFDDAASCTGARRVAELEKFESRKIRATHRGNVAVRLTYTVRNSEKFGHCGGIYELPFQQGHLRVTATHLGPSNQCRFDFGASGDRESWAAVPDPGARTAQEPAFNGGAACRSRDA